MEEKNTAEINGTSNPHNLVVGRSVDMETFLHTTMRDVKRVHILGYRFFWGSTPCYGKVTVMPHHLHLDIYPCDVRVILEMGVVVVFIKYLIGVSSTCNGRMAYESVL